MGVLTVCVLLFVSLQQQMILCSEPQCVSKFDMEFGIMKKLVEMERQIEVLNKESTTQKNTIAALQAQVRAPGDTYVRWGRTECPGNGSNVVYSGYMAGSDKAMPGTGSNYLCLPSDPTWGHYDTTLESVGKITGSEYQFWNHRSTGASAFLGDNVYNHNAPCALCQIQRSTSVMIPGRTNCYDGWTTEYNGYLVSGYYGDKSATEYVCLDSRPEKVVNGDADDEDNRLYFVESVCGKSLACPPYVNGRELACVVCSI